MKVSIPFSKYRVVMLATFAALALLIGPRTGTSQTATGAYAACMDEAAVEANNCYGRASGYLENKACDWAWDINRVACLRALVRATVG